MKDLNELSFSSSQEKSGTEEAEVAEVLQAAFQEETEETQLEKKEALAESTLEDFKAEIVEMMKTKVEGFKNAAMNGAADSVEMHKKALEELDELLEIKKSGLIAKFGDDEIANIQGMITEVRENMKAEFSKIDHYASNLRNTEQMLRNQGAMKEGMEEMGRAKLTAEVQRSNDQRKAFLESNGVSSEGLDEFALGEKSKELRREIAELRGTLANRRVDLGSAHKDIMNNPEGELAGLKEMEQSTRPVETPEKKTLGERVRGIFKR